METIVNRVSQSALISIDLEDYYPKGTRALYDLKDQLFQGLLLREKDFREHIKTHDWSQYQDQYVAITCSADAIIPTWAYMLVATRLTPFAQAIVFGDLVDLETQIMKEAIGQIDFDQFEGAKVVIKGCGELPIPEAAYLELTRKLTPKVSSLMYGEPCSTVPLYKKPKRG